MQQPHTHQTVRLSKGKHTSPDNGACVVELASMLAGEPFSDHPMSVSPVIAAFLRTYNDLLDDRRRQDLYGYAAKIVGSVGSERTERARIGWLLEWADARWEQRARWSLFARVKRREARHHPRLSSDKAARYATDTIYRLSDETHIMVLGLIDELIAIGPAPADAPDLIADSWACGAPAGRLSASN
jgi:hypothetical protein